MEAILQEWEDFARGIWPGDKPSAAALRDHAQEMLHAVIADMQTAQSGAERHGKSRGYGRRSMTSDMVDASSARHALGRVKSGFDLRALVAEYRALRASVLRLWHEAVPGMDPTQLDDMMRFNECLDQLLAESVLSYTASVDQSRELFLGILGHDLKTPLAAMSMAAGLLAENKNLSGPDRSLASQIATSVQDMKCMVADLLDFAGTRVGAKMHVKRQSIGLEQLGRKVMEEIRAQHPSRVFDLDIRGEANGEWDRSRLRQLMTNLLINAVQHGAAQTPIRMCIETDEDEVVLRVCNQGTPIPPDEQTMIFDPLRRRSGEGLSRRSGSLGLGLYIAREVACAHGGSIEVSSNDAETVFTVKLPRNAEASSD